MRFLRRFLRVYAWNQRLLAENESLRERLRVYQERDQAMISILDKHFDLHHLSRRTYIN